MHARARRTGGAEAEANEYRYRGTSVYTQLLHAR
jgi:hypothetical protein